MRITPGRVFRYLRNIHRIDHPARNTVGLLLQATGLSRHLLIDREGYRIRFSPHSRLARGLWVSPRSRLREERFVRSYLTNGDTLVDVGANIGTIAFAGAAAVGASGRVIAIEPHPRTFACLLENGELNGFTNVRYCNRAVGASRGTVGFSNRPDDDQNRVLEGGTIRVEATTLDALLEELGVVSVALLKIDVEGYEKHVLQGAERALARTQCVLIETVERNLSSFGTSSGEILQMLRAHGFRLFRVDHRLEEAVAARDPDGLMARIGALELTEL